MVDEPLPGHEPYVGRLAIPYVTPAGVVDIRFRSMRGEEPKYMGMPGVTTTMFNAQIVLNAKEYICLCEGEIDAITLGAKSIHPAVGIPGVQNWKPFFTKILDDFDRVLILADGDTPGAEFGKKISRELSNVTVIHMPEGHDVNSIVIKEGIDWINERISRCLARN